MSLQTGIADKNLSFSDAFYTKGIDFNHTSFCLRAERSRSGSISSTDNPYKPRHTNSNFMVTTKNPEENTHQSITIERLFQLILQGINQSKLFTPHTQGQFKTLKINLSSLSKVTGYNFSLVTLNTLIKELKTTNKALSKATKNHFELKLGILPIRGKCYHISFKDISQDNIQLFKQIRNEIKDVRKMGSPREILGLVVKANKITPTIETINNIMKARG